MGSEFVQLVGLWGIASVNEVALWLPSVCSNDTEISSSNCQSGSTSLEGSLFKAVWLPSIVGVWVESMLNGHWSKLYASSEGQAKVPSLVFGPIFFPNKNDLTRSRGKCQ